MLAFPIGLLVLYLMNPKPFDDMAAQLIGRALIVILILAAVKVVTMVPQDAWLAVAGIVTAIALAGGAYLSIKSFRTRRDEEEKRYQAAFSSVGIATAREDEIAELQRLEKQRDPRFFNLIAEIEKRHKSAQDEQEFQVDIAYYADRYKDSLTVEQYIEINSAIRSKQRLRALELAQKFEAENVAKKRALRDSKRLLSHSNRSYR